jgi:hypothetical protein
LYSHIAALSGYSVETNINNLLLPIYINGNATKIKFEKFFIWLSVFLCIFLFLGNYKTPNNFQQFPSKKAEKEGMKMELGLFV